MLDLLQEHAKPVHCKYCQASMKDFKPRDGTHLLCTNFKCQSHYYTPMISYFESLYKPAQWFTGKEWEHTYER